MQTSSLLLKALIRPANFPTIFEVPFVHKLRQTMAALILPLRSCLVHIFLVALIPSNTAAIGDYQYQVPCPSDPSLLGYTSIADLNSEMKRHAGLLWNFWMQADSNQQKEPQQLYQYTLCPHTIFDGTEQLNPLLDRTWIRCGRETVNGSKNQCIIRGGKTQVLMIDQGYNSMATTTNEEDKGPERIFVFQGITFTESQDISIAAFATGGTRAEFIDCHWKVCKPRLLCFFMANLLSSLVLNHKKLSFSLPPSFDKIHNRTLKGLMKF